MDSTFYSNNEKCLPKIISYKRNRKVNNDNDFTIV